MSTSLLYHGFAIRGYRYRKTDYVNGEVAFTIEQERETFRCAGCGSDDVESRGTVMRAFQSVPIGKSRWPNSGPDRPNAASNKNRLFSAMPSSMCWPVGDIAHGGGEATPSA